MLIFHECLPEGNYKQKALVGRVSEIQVQYSMMKAHQYIPYLPHSVFASNSSINSFINVCVCRPPSLSRSLDDAVHLLYVWLI